MNGQIVLVVALALAFAFVLGVQLGRRAAYGKISELFQARKYDELLEYLERPTTRFLYPRYNIAYTKFNAFTAKGDSKRASQMLDELLTAKANDEQRHDLVMKAFEFYMNEGRYKDAKDLMDEIRGFASDAMVERCELTYDILARRSYSHIEEMEAQVEGASYANRLSLAYMLALQYKNKGDAEGAARWQDFAEDLLRNPTKD